ncbi:MAG: S8 family serine peptidase [Methanomicrobiales archaeon]|nr:S8 family serine peptidase [Methanomicrobiales archaeon]
MVGRSCECLNVSDSCSSLRLVTGIILLLSVLTGLVLADDEPSSVRLIVYSASNASGGYDPVPPDVNLPENMSFSLRSPELGFIALDIASNKTKFITNELLNIPWVTEVEVDAERFSGRIEKDELINNSSPDQWAFSRIGINSEHGKKNLSPCSVAIIDTGTDSNHPNVGMVISGYDWVDQDSKPEDSDGHGTALSSIVSMIADNASSSKYGSSLSIIPERIGVDGTMMSASCSALAIAHASDLGADIILMGYGGSKPSLAEERAIQYATEKGCVLIASAGNEDSNTMHFPSDNFEVISVGSVAKSDGLSYFSNYGIYTELVAPGEEIISACPNLSYCKGSGTSFAAAEVAGITALVHAAYPGLSSDEIRQVLQSSAIDLGRVGRDIYYGYGLVTLPGAIQAAESLTLQKTLKAFSMNNMTPEIRRNGGFQNTTIHSLSLSPGWNFVSIPAPLKSKKTCRDLFSKINTDSHTIWSYEGGNSGWVPHDPDKTLPPLHGILVYSDKVTSVPLVLDTKGTITMNVTKGWNLVGSPVHTIMSARELPFGDRFSWVSILPFNATNQQYDPAIIRGANGRYGDDRNIQPFSAFWTYLNSDGFLVSSSGSKSF